MTKIYLVFYQHSDHKDREHYDSQCNCIDISFVSTSREKAEAYKNEILARFPHHSAWVAWREVQ